MVRRIIIASIRDLGLCPCPRCLMPLAVVSNMGKARDMKMRKSLARVDDQERRYKVELARGFIYNKGYLVNSNAVERVLRPESLVPNIVSEVLD
jgi:hypothetical protein